MSDLPRDAGSSRSSRRSGRGLHSRRPPTRRRGRRRRRRDRRDRRGVDVRDFCHFLARCVRQRKEHLRRYPRVIGRPLATRVSVKNALIIPTPPAGFCRNVIGPRSPHCVRRPAGPIWRGRRARHERPAGGMHGRDSPARERIAALDRDGLPGPERSPRRQPRDARPRQGGGRPAGYVPNQSGRSLRSGRTGMVAAVIPTAPPVPIRAPDRARRGRAACCAAMRST